MSFFEDISNHIKNKEYQKEVKKIERRSEIWRGIKTNEEINNDKKRDLLELKYKKITNHAFYLSEEEMYSNYYSKAINQESIFNKYADKFTKLCEEYLGLLPELNMYERERDKLTKQSSATSCHRMIKNYIILLGKQENYERQSEVIGFLLSLGITDDGTKGGLKARMKKCEENLIKSRTKEKWFKEHPEYFKNKIYCQNCGVELNNKNKFCTRCGTKIKNEEIEILQ